LSINVGAVVLSALAPFIGIETPLTVVMLLFVNLVMDSLSSIMLGNEPALERYMDEKPRNRDDKIVNKAMFIQFTIMGLYLTAMSILICKIPAISALFGPLPEYAKTGIFPLFIITAMFNVFNCRAENLSLFHKIGENKIFFKVWIAIIAVTVLATIFGGEFFGCTPMGFEPMGWVVVFAVAILSVPFDMLRKVITKRIVGEYN
jgi:magnesium-transporting ATPase (P-type)